MEAVTVMAMTAVFGKISEKSMVVRSSQQGGFKTLGRWKNTHT
jgi:hypothetical protein